MKRICVNIFILLVYICLAIVINTHFCICNSSCFQSWPSFAFWS